MTEAHERDEEERHREPREEREEDERIWGSMIKQTLKRRQPGFNESYYGFPSFNELLEEAQARDDLGNRVI